MLAGMGCKTPHTLPPDTHHQRPRIHRFPNPVNLDNSSVRSDSSLG